jgi:hypothetical protein
MDNLLQTIEAGMLVPQEVDDLERSLKEQRPNASNIRDLTQLYIVAIIYEESEIIDVIHRYMMINVEHGWYLDELMILESGNHFTCRKQHREASEAQEGFVCHKFPPFSDLTSEQIELLKQPYIRYLDRPYIRKYVNLQLPAKKRQSCCSLL